MRQLIRQLVRVEAVAVVVMAWVAGALLLGLATGAGAVPTAALMALGPLLGGLLLLIMHSLELARRIGNLSGESTRTLTAVRRVESDLYKVEREIRQTFRQLETMQNLGAMLPANDVLPATRGWAASPDLIAVLVDLVISERPSLVVECGSGVSTLWLLSLSATFGPSGAIVGGTPGQPGIDGGSSFTVQGTGDQGQPLYQAYSIAVDQNQPLTIVPPSGGSALSPGMVGQAYFGQDFFLSGGAGPYTWSLIAGQLLPGMFLQTTAGPRDASNQLAGTPTTTGTFAFTMRVSDYDGQQATQQFSLTVDPPLQISTTPLATGTVGVPYSRDLIAQGGAPPYAWFVVTSINELPPGLTLGTAAPDLNNVLTGTPTQAGTFSFPMQVQDSQDNTATGTVTVTINP